MTDWGAWEREEGLDRWDGSGGLIGQIRVGKSCSFCGSLNPDRFMELVREGWIVGPTDKPYKAYLSRALTDDEKTARKQRWMELDGIARAIRDLGERDGKTAEQIQSDLEHEWGQTQVPLLESGGGQEAKFYYQHLSEAQRDEFIDLVNSGALKIGYPGYLYVLPFFCVRREPS